MNKTKNFAFTLFLLIAGNCYGFETFNFKSGLAKFETNEIYSVIDKSKYVINGKCTVANKTEDCMQWGFSFDYSEYQSQNINCSFSLSKPEAHVTNNEVLSKNTTKGNFQINLESTQGHYFHPMYFVKTSDDHGVQKVTITCTSANTKIGTANFMVQYD